MLARTSPTSSLLEAARWSPLLTMPRCLVVPVVVQAGNSNNRGASRMMLPADLWSSAETFCNGRLWGCEALVYSVFYLIPHVRHLRICGIQLRRPFGPDGEGDCPSRSRR